MLTSCGTCSPAVACVKSLWQVLPRCGRCFPKKLSCCLFSNNVGILLFCLCDKCLTVFTHSVVLCSQYVVNQSNKQDSRVKRKTVRVCVCVCVCVCVGAHVNEQENTRRVVNNRFNECV